MAWRRWVGLAPAVAVPESRSKLGPCATCLYRAEVPAGRVVRGEDDVIGMCVVDPPTTLQVSTLNRGNQLVYLQPLVSAECGCGLYESA